MEKHEIHIDDLRRIFIGEVTGEFYFEVILRTVLIYAILIISMRLMGQRMASQLSRIEMAAMVSLAAAIGVPLHAPDRGLLPAIIIAIVVVVVERIVAYRIARSEEFEALSQDNLAILVEDGVMNIALMKETRITKERLSAILRQEGLVHLGAVKRVYFEANGSFSIVPQDESVPGLCILPDWDEEFISELDRTEKLVCEECGDQNKNSEIECNNCGSKGWTKAVSTDDQNYA